MSLKKTLLTILAVLSISQAQVKDSVQNVPSLFNSNENITFAIPQLEISVTPFGGHWGSMIGTSGGMVINNQLMLGVGFRMNISNPEVNFGYIGFLAQYRVLKSKSISPYVQLLTGYGSLRRYLRPKTSLFDNFANIGGARFAVIEPTIGADFNITRLVQAQIHCGYRITWGYRETETWQTQNFENENMNGIVLGLSLRIKKSKRVK